MLHPDVLVLLYHFAKYSTGAVLEIGSYIGGATVAISFGLRDSGADRQFISVEPGGAYPDHPHLPTKDIIADLKMNLQKWDVAEHVQLVTGFSREAHVYDSVKSAVGASRIGLICIDADGHVDKDLEIYGSLLSSGTYLVVDDYSGNEEIKVLPTKRTLDAMVENNQLECLGIYGWGTWVGRIK